MGLELRVNELSAGYPGQVVLDGVAFSVLPGQVLGLIGPNGAGKSTLLRTLSRTLPVRTGLVQLGERPIGDWPLRDLARHLAVMGTQEVPQSPGLTIRAYVGLGRTPHQDRWGLGRPQDRVIVEQAMTQVGIAHLADRPFASVSAGERQRAQLARALAQEPDVLLLDEPTSHLDIGRQQALLNLLKDVAAAGVAVVAALHDLNLAAAVCDRLLLLQGGRVIAFGPPAEVLTPARLEAAYGHPWLIRPHPQTGRPWVFPAEAPPRTDAAPLLHLIGGGGSLHGLAGPLRRLGYNVQAGVLHDGDSDVQVCRDLGVPALVAPAFAPVAGGRAAELAAWLARADGVIVGDVPFGPANLGILQALATLRQQNGDLPVWTVSARSWAERDFCEGQVPTLAEQLAATPLPDAESAVQLLATMKEAPWPPRS